MVNKVFLHTHQKISKLFKLLTGQREKSAYQLNNSLQYLVFNMARPEHLRNVNSKKEKGQQDRFCGRDCDVLYPFADPYMDGKVVRVSGYHYRKSPVSSDQVTQNASFL